ncbi:MAG: DUF1566 domain-containing protein [Deltaproteobacteria bacterium]|nr:DUF1566 domain-containing protein [Deltaproteobacteria bacterium]
MKQTGAKRPRGALTMLVLMAALLLPAAAAAGDLEPSAGPEATSSYTLEDIYNRLKYGAPRTQSTFTGPADGPTVPTGQTLNQVMGEAPEQDEANGAVATEVAEGKTFWGLTGGEWGQQTGTAEDGSCPEDPDLVAANIKCGVEISGIVGTYDCAPACDTRYCDNGDGTVTDTDTGLVWLKNANCYGRQDWNTAMSFVAGLNNGECGLSDGSSAGDWRLATKAELPWLGNNGGAWTKPGAPFVDVQSSPYWSGTSYAINTDYAWIVNMANGGVNGSNKSSIAYVWPVRGDND